MNKERILELADVIEKQPHADYLAKTGFHMEAVTHNCGTPCCIAGWANSHFGGSDDLSMDSAMSLLGLEEHQRGDLFLADNTDLTFDDITPAIAAAVLRHLAETGEVDWSVGASVEAA